MILETALGKQRPSDEPNLADIVPFNENPLRRGNDSSPSVVVSGLLFTVLVIVISIITSIALLPAYHWGLWVQWKEVSLSGTTNKKVLVRRDNAPWSHMKVTSSVVVYGLLVPLVIPIFMVALSVVLIAAKWLVIGRYSIAATSRTSMFFLRWWFVDRLLDLYELLAGNFIFDTILMNIFCLLMGADVAMTARIKTLPREYDLVTIGDRAVVSGLVYCRMFHHDGQLRFEPVVIGRRAEVKSTAVVMPGSTVDEGAILDHGAATAPGMYLSENTVYHSSPARMCGRDVVVKKKKDESSFSLWFEMTKVMTMGLFLYTSFVTSNVLTEFLLRQLDWYEWKGCRYRELAYYSLGFFTALFISGVLVVVFKWILVGRRVAGDRVPTNWTWRTWFLEWIWYRILLTVGAWIWEENGVVSIALLRVLGANVAWTAKLAHTFFVTPGEADLIDVGANAVTSGFTTSCQGNDGVWKRITLEAGCQIGLRSRVNAGVVVQRGAVVGHQTIVPEDVTVETGTTMFADRVFTSHHRQEREQPSGLYYLVIQPGLRIVAIVLLGFVALIPAYELGILLFYGRPNYCTSTFYERGFKVQSNVQLWRPPVNRTVALLVVGPIGLVALASIAVVFRMYQWIVLGDWKSERSTLFKYVHMEYQETSIRVNSYVMAFLRGTPLAVAYMRFFGADVAASACVYSSYFGEPPLLTIGPDAVIDDRSPNFAHVYEHGNLVFRRKVIGPNAILHPVAITWAGDVVPPGVILGPRGQLAKHLHHHHKNNPTAVGHPYRPGTFLQGCPARDYTDLFLAARVEQRPRTF